MKRLSVLILFLAGCSTAPVADLMDYFVPGRIAADKALPQGGVCGPQQPGGPVVSPPSALPQPVFPTTPPGGAQPLPTGPNPQTPILVPQLGSTPAPQVPAVSTMQTR